MGLRKNRGKENGPGGRGLGGMRLFSDAGDAFGGFFPSGDLDRLGPGLHDHEGQQEGKKGKQNAASAEPAPVQQSAAAGTPLPGTQSQGTLELDGVDEPTAAVIMAIVSDESGIPLNRLLFKSIKKKD